MYIPPQNSTLPKNLKIIITDLKSKQMELKTYMDNNEHLPSFMKDFHDQKDLFKAIYEQWKDGKHEVLESVSWANAHIFTIDFFLWWMALHGYTLQKSRKKNVDFYNPIETIEKCRNIRIGKSSEILKNALK